jgi:hypothetical protein
MLLFLQMVGMVNSLAFRKKNKFGAARAKNLGYKFIHSTKRTATVF